MKGMRDDEETEEGGRWLRTFNDLVTLLLTFFVLILSMSMIDPGKLTEATAAARNTFKGAKASPAAAPRFEPFALPTRDRDIEREKAKKRSGDAVGSRLPGGLDDERMRMIEMLKNLQGIGTKIVPEGLSIRLEESLLFSPGSAEIQHGDDRSLAAVMTALHQSDAFIRVEGRAGDRAGEDQRSEWALSTARSLSGVRLLIDEGGIAPERLSAGPCMNFKPAIPMPDGGDRVLHPGMVLVVRFQAKEE